MHYRAIEVQRADIEEALIVESVVPDKAKSLTVLLDRVSLPMEETRKRRAGRPRKAQHANRSSERFEWRGSAR
jgi:hypothetical protein